MKFYITLTFALILLLISCGRKEYTEQGILEIKKEIDSILYNPEAEEHFNWGSEKAYSNFRAYFHDNKLIFINEDFRYRQPGEQFNRYYFKDGNMLYFVGRALTFDPDKNYTNIELIVDPDGNVMDYSASTPRIFDLNWNVKRMRIKTSRIFIMLFDGILFIK